MVNSKYIYIYVIRKQKIYAFFCRGVSSVDATSVRRRLPKQGVYGSSLVLVMNFFGQ